MLDAVYCFLKNLRRIKRALEKAESFTITEVRVPMWLAKEILNDRQLLQWDVVDRVLFDLLDGPGRSLRVWDRVCCHDGVNVVVNSEPQIRFSYKKVA